MNKLIYLCLQVTKEGQASHAHVHEIINGLRKMNWEISLYEPSYVKMKEKPGISRRLLEFIKVQISLLLNMNQIKPNAIYIRNHFATFPTALWARMTGNFIVQEVNGPYEDLFIAWPWTRNLASLFKWLIRVQLKWANAVIVVTPQLEKWVQVETRQQHIYVVPNAANSEIFYPDAETKYQDFNEYVVFFGALARWQGIETLLKAVSNSQWPSDVNLLIVGDGDQREIVEKASAINSKIFYLGFVPYSEVPGIVANSIAGLSPMNNEGGRSVTGLYPLKLFETMACGVPVIVTDFPGQADLVKQYDCGIVVPAERPEEIAKAVAYLYHNKTIAFDMGRRGRKAIEELHSWKNRAEDTNKVLCQLLDKDV